MRAKPTRDQLTAHTTVPNLNWIANYIWGIADDVLRDVYVRGKYRDVILPMTVLRRLDAVLEPTKRAVLDMKATLDAAGVTNQDAALRQAAGQAFHNTSEFTLSDLRARAGRQQLRADFEDYEMEVGDIVLGMDRPIIQAGTRVAVVSASDVPSLLLQRVARIRVKEGLRGDYAVELIGGKGFSDYLAPIFTGISVPHLSAEQIKTFRFALPNVAEQLAIMHHVESRKRALRSATSRILQQVHLLREYRTRLIADAVTGKLDVREAAARLPETDPVAGDRDRTDTIPAESNLLSTESHMAKEAIP